MGLFYFLLFTSVYQFLISHWIGCIIVFNTMKDFKLSFYLYVYVNHQNFVCSSQTLNSNYHERKQTVSTLDKYRYYGLISTNMEGKTYRKKLKREKFFLFEGEEE